MKRKPLIYLVPLVFVIAFPWTARAQGNIHLGKLEIHPGLNVSYTNTDNILQLPADQKAKENTIEVVPGLELRFPTSNHLFRLGYDLSIYSFQEMKKTKLKNSVMGSLEFNFPVGLILRLSDNYAQRVYPTATMLEQAGIAEHWENNGFAEIGYTLNQRWSLSGRYKNQMLRFQNLDPYNRDVNSGGAALFMRIMTRLSLFGEAWYGKVGYKVSASTGQDATYIQGFLGLGGRVSPKTNFTLKAGYENRTYKNSTLYPDTKGLIASLVLEEKPSSHISISVNGSRAVNESIYENNSFYISTGGGANLTMIMIRMLAIGADFSYFLLQYDKANLAGIKRQDKVLAVGPSLKVDITRWLRFQGGYSLRNRSSNADGLDYKENRIEASLNAIL
ncbi:MAG: outer membrane beta-barrel protein [Proteobacteria bacterium]|jgi:hypothetical protein|nr:outer membrane beta-barrel protein [Pseudomonadota bacterium]